MPSPAIIIDQISHEKNAWPGRINKNEFLFDIHSTEKKGQSDSCHNQTKNCNTPETQQQSLCLEHEYKKVDDDQWENDNKIRTTLYHKRKR